jgi:uncharacterized protein YndB with AHSA1/START domain
VLTQARTVVRRSQRSAAVAAIKRRATGRSERAILTTRVFDAAPEQVFKAWTDAKLLAVWWGPKGYTTPVCELNARPGGALRLRMRTPDGATLAMRGIFHEIVEPERLVLTTSAFGDERGRPRLKTKITVALVPQDGKTQLRLKAIVVRSKPEVAAAGIGTEEGWQQSLERLAGALATL